MIFTSEKKSHERVMRSCVFIDSEFAFSFHPHLICLLSFFVLFTSPSTSRFTYANYTTRFICDQFRSRRVKRPYSSSHSASRMRLRFRFLAFHIIIHMPKVHIPDPISHILSSGPFRYENSSRQPFLCDN